LCRNCRLYPRPEGRGFSLVTSIANREITSRELLDDALDELVDSARANGISDDEIAAALRVRGAGIADGEGGEAEPEPEA